jgi:uncharacterized protein
MKFLIWALVLVLAWYWFKHHRKGTGQAPGQRPHRSRPEPSAPQAMVDCPVCQVHLPRSEAFVGRLGAYCSESHRAQREA